MNNRRLKQRAVATGDDKSCQRLQAMCLRATKVYVCARKDEGEANMLPISLLFLLGNGVTRESTLRSKSYPPCHPDLFLGLRKHSRALGRDGRYVIYRGAKVIYLAKAFLVVH